MPKNRFIIFSLLFILSGPFFANAATFTVEVSTGTETINALEGTLSLPRGATVGDIYTGNSIVLIWISEPKYDKETNTITFAGLTPGGFKGRQAVFTIETEAGSLSGASFVSLNGYKNDGVGTQVALSASLSPYERLLDKESPEPFVPNFSQSPDLFDGQTFISFSAQDKNSGIDHYEFATTWLFSPSEAAWRTIESPYALSMKEKFQRIHLRAFDKENNLRTVSTAGPNWYLTLAFGLIIIACSALYLRRSFSRFS